jgi:hypothetical protein
MVIIMVMTAATKRRQASKCGETKWGAAPNEWMVDEDRGGMVQRTKRALQALEPKKLPRE